jgi:hypothetical protein
VTTDQIPPAAAEASPAVRMPRRLEQMGCGRHRFVVTAGEGPDRVFACVDCPLKAYPGQLFHGEVADWYDSLPAARA